MPAEPIADGRGPNRWRGTDMAERRAVRRRALVEAGYQLVGTVGWAGTTVRGVCQAAALNPRYFYESFADLDELLLAVYDHVVAEGTAALVQVGAEATPELAAMVRAMVSAAFRFLADDPRRARVLFVEGAGHPALDRRRFDTLLAMADRVKAVGARLAPPDGPPGLGHQDAGQPVDPRADRLGTVAANLLVGGVTELCVAWLDGHLAMTLDELADAVTVLAVGTAETAARRAACPD